MPMTQEQTTTAKAFADLLPPHLGGLTITHNEHKGNYETAKRWLDEVNPDAHFADHEARRRAIDTDSIWEIHFYPDTPVGFYEVFAPTLPEALALALSCIPDKET